MCFSSETTKALGAMIVAPPSPSRASVFSMCFLEEVLDYDLSMDLVDDTDGVTLPDTYKDEMDMIDIGRILYATPHEPHSAFDMFGVYAIDFEDVTLYDAYAMRWTFLSFLSFWMQPHLGPALFLICFEFLC